MNPLLDIHLHTNLSSCSSFPVEELIRFVRERRLPVVTVTDHGTAAACDILAESLDPSMVLYGVEVTTRQGDFLVYSLDIEYIRSLGTYAGSVTDLRCDGETALIWAHPRVPQVHGWESPSTQDPEIETVLNHVDGLEIFNGMMLGLAAKGVVRPPYFNHLNYLADRYNVAITGGSDSHEAESYFTAWTEFETPVNGPADVIAAIKAGKVRPCYDHAAYAVDVDLSPIWTNG